MYLQDILITTLGFSKLGISSDMIRETISMGKVGHSIQISKKKIV